MINIKKIITKKAQISLFEIVVLMLAIFSFSYILYENIKPVEAQMFDEVCCERTNTGELCKYTSPDQCDSGYRKSPTSCEATDYCKIGCCFSDNTGLCNLRSTKTGCEEGQFFDSEFCQVEECNKGCCLLGDEAKWTTERNCEVLSGGEYYAGIPMEFRSDIPSEIECLFTKESEAKGACIIEEDDERNCIYTTLDECYSRTNDRTNFYKDYFCSNPELNSTCEAKHEKGCLEGKEDVYWFDSCGNQEDLAEDCNYFDGTYCGKLNDNYICKDLSCNVGGETKRNGESWCLYDGVIGKGKDPAGSRHYKHICYMGEERVEPCSDFRNEICVEEDTLLDDGTSMSQAACRVNRWRTCFDYNREEGSEKMKDKCEKNPDCWVKKVDMGGSFNFEVCLPAYPPGFDLNQEFDEMIEYTSTAADGVCNIGTLRCTETWKCGIFGCVCKDNCKCHTHHFTQDLNDLCISLGDCGAYINYLGDYTETGYSVKVIQEGEKGPPRLSKAVLNSFKKYAIPVPGQKAAPGGYEFYDEITLGNSRKINSGAPSNESRLDRFEKELLEVSGAYGSPILLDMMNRIINDANETITQEILSGVTAGTVNFATYSNAVATAKEGINAQIVFEETENKDWSMLAAMIAGLIAYVITQSIVATLIAALLAFLFAISWIKYVDIDFKCMPWEPPTGGAKCNECNQVEKPCSEYRCESLGQLCHIINKGTTEELCVARETNGSAPMITPFYEIITEGFEYYDVEANGFNVVDSEDKGCIPAYTSVRFGIKVEPFARCRVGTDPKQTYIEMADTFGFFGNKLLPAHRMDLFFVSKEGIENEIRHTEGVDEIPAYIQDDLDGNFSEPQKLFIKCQTAEGKTNPEPFVIESCVKEGPDLTAPYIIRAEPPNNGYIKYGETETDLKIFVNEPSTCKWSDVDKSYEQMENTFTCEQRVSKYVLFGLPCTTKLEGLTNRSTFYVKCQDISENKNTMTESYVYTIKLSKSNLEIVSIAPRSGEEFFSEFEPFTIELGLKTEGGAVDGISVCEWETAKYSDTFTETNDSRHRYLLNSVREGSYTVNFKCEDVAGNIATNSTTFRAEVDDLGPKISRIYFDGGLKVITQEESECRYSNSRKFDYDNATIMDTTDGYEHKAYWTMSTYYIQCMDDYNNKGRKITVFPYELTS